jgi:hypothetical protein
MQCILAVLREEAYTRGITGISVEDFIPLVLHLKRGIVRRDLIIKVLPLNGCVEETFGCLLPCLTKPFYRRSYLSPEGIWSGLDILVIIWRCPRHLVWGLRVCRISSGGYYWH